MIRTPFLSLLLAAGLATGAGAQSSHDHSSMDHGTMDHSTMDHGAMSTPAVLPTEPGQGAFATIAEIVAMLQADPDTDWSRVDIPTLRQHLIDMDMLVTHAEVSAEETPGGAVFRASMTGPGGGAVSRMVPAHAGVLATETGWTSQAVQDGEQIVWTVTSPQDAEIIRALGFFGLMAVGGHHQAHHLGMATGQMVH